MDTRIQGAIFDMDGVISDTQSLHARIESDLLRRYGIIMSPEEIIRRFAGTADKEMFPAIFTEAGKRAPDVDAIVAQKYSLMMAPDVAVPEIPGTKAFIASLQRLGIPLAVASASSMEFIRFVVEKLELISSFKALVSSDEVAHGKPAPDVFLLAAKRIDIEPQSCLVIEDGVSGMIAAEKAGMKSIALLTHREAGDCPTSVSFIVRDLQDVPLSIF